MDEQPTNTSSKEMYQSLDNEHKILPCELEPKATLESINDDCLLYIFKYLSILEVSKVAATCTRLQNFANDFIYPKSAKQIQIKFLESDDDSPSTITDVMSLKDPFENFGYFVESLIFDASNKRDLIEDFSVQIEEILGLCPNLHTLSFDHVYLGNILKYVPSNIKEINFHYCGIPFDWCDSFKKFPQLNSVTFTNFDKSAGNFLKHSTTLSSLTIDAGSSSEEDLMMFLNTNGRRLQTLTLIDFSSLQNFESIVTLIATELPELKNLGIFDNLSKRLKATLYKLPHLKFLRIFCHKNCRTLLRILSDQNLIEELDISVFVDLEYDDNEEPLIFKQLRKLRFFFSSVLPEPPFLSLITKSHMPVINSITMHCYEKEIQWKYILKLFESKKSLETFRIFGMEDARAIPLLYGIIEILKADRNRPFLTLHIPRLTVGTNLDLLHLLNANRHLVNVNPKVKSVMTKISVRNGVFYEDETDYSDSDESW